MNHASFEHRLTAAGYSLTKPRRSVYHLLARSEPLTLQELVTFLPAIDRSSIYRTITLFENLGIIQRLHIGWKYKIELSNEYQAHHHHASCQRCGTSYELAEDDLIEKRLHTLTSALGFQAHDHQLEISGICKNCQNRLKPKEPETSSGSTRKPHTSY